MRIVLVISALVVALGAFGFVQYRSSLNTAGDWAVTHYKAFGLWDAICDQRQARTGLQERCYLRYVDVFSPRPQFAAQFIFITVSGTPEVDIGLERGTRFRPEGMRIEDDTKVLWSTDRRGCMRGGKCRFSGTEAEPIFAALEAGDTFAFDFVDRHGNERALRWDLGAMKDALMDLSTETRRRNL